MATINLQDTIFTFTVQNKPKRWDGYGLYVRIAVENEFVHYQSEHHCSFEDVENILFCMRRLLAGGYRKEISVRLEEMNAILHFEPNIPQNPPELTRTFLRSCESKLIWNLLFYSNSKQNTLGGVYTLFFSKIEVATFADVLQFELQAYVDERNARRGEYMFVGVSPQGYKGCNYWYLDTKKQTKTHSYVWVKMGKSSTLQLVYVDNVRYFSMAEAPYDVSSLKQVEGQASEEDLIQAQKIWKE